MHTAHGEVSLGLEKRGEQELIIRPDLEDRRGFPTTIITLRRGRPRQERRVSQKGGPSLSFSFITKLEPKAEIEALSSQTLIFNDGGMTPPKPHLSPAPTLPPLTASASGFTSRASTPPLDLPSMAHNLRMTRASPVQLIGDLPVARQEALASFNEIVENSNQHKTLGRSREALESMTCDCVYEPGQFFFICDPTFTVVGL